MDEYSYKIKNLMMQNDILFETEIIYLINFKHPSQNSLRDADAWRKDLIQSLKVIIDESIRKLKNIQSKDVGKVLYLLTYCTQEQIRKLLGSNFVDNIQSHVFPINDCEIFLEELIQLAMPHLMKRFYYSNVKIYSLYEMYEINT